MVRKAKAKSVLRGRTSLAAVAVAGLLCIQPARADLIQEFANEIAAQAAAAAAPKDLRPIPDHATEGVMFPPQGRLVAIDDKVMLLAPGSRIRDLENRIVLPSAITQPVNVRYTVDLYSHVHHVWLMGGEVKLEDKQQGNNAEN